MTGPATKSETVRLGRAGSYRLGRLGMPGVPRPAAPRSRRPYFSRPRRRGPVSAWILAGLAGVALTSGGALRGLWFAPFVVGLAAGLATRWGGWRPRVSIPAVLVIAVAGQGLPFWVPALHGGPAGAMTGLVVALAGQPASAPLGVAATVAVGGAQGLAGLWLGRAVVPRPLRS